MPFTADGVGAWDVASRRFRLLGLANGGGFGGFKFLGAVQAGAGGSGGGGVARAGGVL